MNRRDLFKLGGATLVAAPVVASGEYLGLGKRFGPLAAVPPDYQYATLNVAGQVIPHLPAVNINLGSDKETYHEVILTDIGVAL